MKVAIAFNTATKMTEFISPQKYAALMKSGKHKVLDLYSPIYGDPVTYRKGRSVSGQKKFVTGHFARLPGMGRTDHLFDREQGTFKREVESGKKVLLALNLDLLLDETDFGHIATRHGSSLLKWIAANHGKYVSAPAGSAQQAIKTIKKVKGWIGKESLNDRLFVVYRGAVLPYKDFYLGSRQSDIADLYRTLRDGKEGVKFNNGETRFIGFPRLFHFLPTRTTLESGGAQGLKGNVIVLENETKKLLSHLIFPDPNQRDSEDFTTLWNYLEDDPEGGVYVLASPCITIDKEGEMRLKGEPRRGLEWKMLLWLVQNIHDQTAVPDERVRPKAEIQVAAPAASPV